MKVIILAGGGGTRLFPLSRTQYPKQFLKIFDNTSLLVQSALRFSQIVKPEDIIVVTGSRYEFHVRNELNSCGMGKAHVLLEPEGRNTAPAIALAVAYCRDELGSPADEIFFVSTSDHLISPVNVFLRNVRQGMNLTGKGKVVVFGVKPERPETGFGYIKTGENIYNSGYTVESFKEKPDAATAENYLAAGDYYWNSGMFIFQMDVFLRELAEHAPKLSDITKESFLDMLRRFKETPNISIDCAIAEQSRNMAMVVLNCFWNDIGSWDTIYDAMDKDEYNNAQQGDVVTIDCKDSLFLGKKRLIAGVGLNDILVVETDDVILVAQKGESQKVKDLVEKLREDGREEADGASTVYRPWGCYTVVEEGPTFKIKTIVVDPGASLSMQMHYHRSEHWVVTEGTANVNINGAEQILYKNQSIFVPMGARHRLSNPGMVPLEIVEVQNGEYLGEDDIVRFEDDYGRSKL